MANPRKPLSSAGKEQRIVSAALSDVFLAGCQLYAASVCFTGLSRLHQNPRSGDLRCALCGFLLVALAAITGAVRYAFGANTKPLSKLNKATADVAGYVGLPLVGLHYYRHSIHLQDLPAAVPLYFVLACVVNQSVGRLFDAENGREAHRVLTNVLVFLLPAISCGMLWGSNALLASTAIFALAGILVGPSLERRIFGIRRGVLFNTALGVAAVLMSSSLSPTS